MIQSLRVIAAWLECFPEKPSWCRNEQVCQGGGSIKRFQRSKGLDTALHKNYLFFLVYLMFNGYLLNLRTCCISDKEGGN